jgi:Putative adhesin
MNTTEDGTAMPSFDTPQPISVNAQVDAGSIQFTAADRLDTVVEVRPRDPKKDKDTRAAEQTQVTYAGGVLTIRTPKQRYLIGPTGTVDVTVELPTGSRIDLIGAWTQVLGEGRLGEVRVKTSSGDVRLDTTGPLQLTASHGSITVDRIEGMAEITTSSGSLRVGTADGPAVLKNSHGTTTVGAATGDLRVSGANGDISIARAESSVTATTAHGTLRVAEVARGTVQLETSYGAIEVGIREGTAAWLDADSEHGQVRNTLADSEAPGETEDTVKVRARTRYGNIDVRRATLS